ncbi:RNA polymerase sigma factor [Streptomyces cupreus]|uniref:Sigma-70 family RNA polymerase sigma factor n=1 Tax=Streptomyces cupreus TaxID=2759956 RepID=A0A7X1J2Q7_9ACTN|nr:sigma-70 family RNA polymerase sigma factor [Streptomyces cupreus]MBC2902450.1 sigma-70 family RNA polymerase sigma factor [Streptomyces cupreus]
MGEAPDAESSRTSAERWQRIWAHREQLLRVARRRSASAQDAEDAVYEAMARAAERPHLDDDRLGAWLTSVTVRLCVDRYRQLNRDAGICRRAGAMLTVPSAVPYDEALCDRAEAQWLALQGARLPAQQAEALRLKAEDLDVAQVAQLMGVTYKAAESLLGRARRALRAVLAATLTVVAGVWRGRPRAENGAPAAAPTGALVSVGATVMLAGLVLVSPVEADGATTPRPGKEPPGVASTPLSTTPEPARSMDLASAPDAEDRRTPVPSGPTGRPGGTLPTGQVPASASESAPEERALPGAPTVGQPTLPLVPPLAVPEDPAAMMRLDDAVSVLSELPDPPVPTAALPVPLP